MTTTKTNRLGLRASATSAAAILLSASPVSAQDIGPYGSVGAVYATSDADEIEQVQEDSGHFQARLGYSLNRYFAAEIEGSIAVVASGAGRLNDDGGRLILDRSFAGFVLARYPATDQFAVFVRGGYHYSRLGLRAGDLEQTIWRDDFAYGAGATYSLSDSAIRLDYTRFKTDLASETVNHRMISISYVRSF